MSIILVTGSSGLIGSETVKFFHQQGFDVVGLDNNMREYFFGPEASVEWNASELTAALPRYSHRTIDVRNSDAVDSIFKAFGQNIKLVVHCAGQPSHDWAAREPMTDFSVNAVGTMVLLEAARKFATEAVFIFTSTNKVYGDTPNTLPLVECEQRWELEPTHLWSEFGIDR